MQPEATFDRLLRGIGDDALRRYGRFEAAFLKGFRGRLKVGRARSIRCSELSRRNELVEHRRISAALLADQTIEFAAVAQRKMHVRTNASRRRFQNRLGLRRARHTARQRRTYRWNGVRTGHSGAAGLAGCQCDETNECEHGSRASSHTVETSLA